MSTPEEKRNKSFWDNIPEDDEPLTDEELEAIKDGEKDLKAGNTLSFDEGL